MKVYVAAAALIASLYRAEAQQAGKTIPEVHPGLPMQTCTACGVCKTEPTKIVLEANRRRLLHVDNGTPCYNVTSNLWNREVCPDPKTCATNCGLEGADYAGVYGVDAPNNGAVSLKLVTKSPSLTSIGPRIYLLENDNKYKMFTLLNQEFSFDVDMSNLPCGLNGALYFLQMDADGGMAKYPTNKAGPAYGTGYCDAQCPKGKFINGEANINKWSPSKTQQNGGSGEFGSCCAEIDVWEANKMSTTMVSHPCPGDGQTRCTTAEECKVCVRKGCDFNPYRMNNKKFYGPGPEFTVDTTKPFTVVTQFITDDKTENGNLVEMKRFYKQNGKVIENPTTQWSGLDPVSSITDAMCLKTMPFLGDADDHNTKGGLRSLGESMRKGVVLAMSIWADEGGNMHWLDANSPANGNPATPGVARGSCSMSGGNATEIYKQTPTPSVTYSNFRVGALGSTTADSAAQTNCARKA